MNLNKNLNKVVDIVFGIGLITALLLITNGNLIVYAATPVILSLIYLIHSRAEYALVLLGSLLMGLFFTDLKDIVIDGIILLSFSLVFIGLSKSKLSDKYQIIIASIITSLVFIGVYKYSMIASDISIENMAMELKNQMAASSNYKLDLKTYEAAFSIYPAILASFASIYSIISLKVIRNYMSYKGLGYDMGKLNLIRIEKSDLPYLIAFALIIAFVAWIIGIGSNYIVYNIGWILGFILFLNGLSAYDFLTSYKRSPLASVLQWILIIMFISFFAIFFVFFGIADIIIDIRRKVRRPDARK